MPEIGTLDVTQIVDNLMVKERTKINELKVRKEKVDIEISQFGQLKSLFDSFQEKIGAIKRAFNTLSYTATSSNTSALSVSVKGDNIITGNHTVHINTLAIAQLSKSTQFSVEDSALNSTDVLTFANAADPSKQFSIALDATDSLETVRDKINNTSANIGVTASIVSSNDVSGNPQYSLLLSAEDTGTSNGFTISGDTANLFAFSTLTGATDATLTFDNYNVVRGSNTIDDIMDGFTINLLQANTDVNINVAVNAGAQKEAVANSIKEMLDAYNQVNTFIDLTYYHNNENEGDANEEASLHHLSRIYENNDSTLFTVKMNLQESLQQTFANAGSFNSLGDIGIISSRNKTVDNSKNAADPYVITGGLELDTKFATQFSTLLDTDFEGLKHFFTDPDTGFVDTMNKQLDQTIVGNKGYNQALLSVAMDQAKQLDQNYLKRINNETDHLDDVRLHLTLKISALNGLLMKLGKESDYLDQQIEAFKNLNKS